MNKHEHTQTQVFLRVREDITWEDVKEAAKTKKPFSEQKKVQSELKKQVKTEKQT